LIFCHRPDIETPIEETVWAMSDIISQGKALYWGTSEWSAEQIMQAYAIAEKYGLRKPQMEQSQYNMLWRERVEKEYLRLYKEIGLGLTIWNPLASGLLTGKYNNGIPPESRLALPGFDWLKDRAYKTEKIEKIKKLQPIAGGLGCTMAQLALAWCLKNPGVSTVITGASRVEQVVENIKALRIVPLLTGEIMSQIEAVLENKPEINVL
jgi:aryl-alcohol dehydrogenase-like predicted oxidoreductase